MGKDQEVLAYCCLDPGAVPAKAVAYEANLSLQYIYQLMTHGRRTVPTKVFNAVLRIAEIQMGNTSLAYWDVASRVLPLLLSGTNLQIIPRNPSGGPPDPALSGQVGVLIEDMGGVVRSTGRILADGKIDESDQVHAAELDTKGRILTGRLWDLMDAVAAKTKTPTGAPR